MAAGLAGIATSAGLIALIGPHTNLWWMRLMLFALGYCMPHVMMSTQAATFATMAPAATGRASTLFNAQRQMGGAVGVAVVSTVVAAVGPTKAIAGRVLPNLASYHDAFLTAAAVALVGAVLALALVHDSDAAATMVRRGRLHGHPIANSAATAGR
jgi:MFS family permease